MINNDKLIIQKLDSISNTNLLLLQLLQDIKQHYMATNNTLKTMGESHPEDIDFDSEPSDENNGEGAKN